MNKPWEKKIPDTENQALNPPIVVSEEVTQILQEGADYANQMVKQVEEQFESHPSPEIVAGQPHDYLNMIVEWNYINDQIKALKDKEMALRTKLAGFYFPSPKEGTNTTDLPDGWKLKGKFQYYRNIDKAALPAVLEKLPEGTEDKVINYKPELKLRDYKNLLEDHKKIFDEALVIKPGTPSLELVPPKEPKT